MFRLTASTRRARRSTRRGLQVLGVEKKRKEAKKKKNPKTPPHPKCPRAERHHASNKQESWRQYASHCMRSGGGIRWLQSMPMVSKSKQQGVNSAETPADGEKCFKKGVGQRGGPISLDGESALQSQWGEVTYGIIAPRFPLSLPRPRQLSPKLTQSSLLWNIMWFAELGYSSQVFFKFSLVTQVQKLKIQGDFLLLLFFSCELLACFKQQDSWVVGW